MKIKQDWKKCFCVFLTIILCCVFLSCSFSSSSGSEPVRIDSDDPFSYVNVSRMQFIGGSMLYSPTEQRTNQLLVWYKDCYKNEFYAKKDRSL